MGNSECRMKKKVAVKLKRWEAEKLKAQSESSKERFTAEDAKNTERFGADSKAHGAKRSKSWEEGKLKAQASKRYDDGRLRIKAEAKKSVASNLQLPTAEGLLNHLNHPLKSPWKQKKILLTNKSVFIIRMIISLKRHWDIAEETYGIFHYAS
jgi:hypothetical protein